MTNFSEHNPAENESASNLIRLGCLNCDRNDFDGVAELPNDWIDVSEIQTNEQSLQPVEDSIDSGPSLFDWQTHVGLCPDCQADEEREILAVHPLIKQIVDRDCHVSESNSHVVQHVISKLRDGRQTFREMSADDRQLFIEQCLQHHRGNRQLYAEVMSGFRPQQTEELPSSSMTGAEIVSLMRKHHKTIAALAFRLGITQKRIRQVRQAGLHDALAVRDWIEAITGIDPGPIPEQYRVSRREETECSFCDYPLFNGDDAFEYVGDVFCSINCCRKSRGW